MTKKPNLIEKNNENATIFINNVEAPEFILDILTSQLVLKYPSLTEILVTICYSLNEYWNNKTQKLVAQYQVYLDHHNRSREVKLFSVFPETGPHYTEDTKHFVPLKLEHEVLEKIPITVNFDFNLFQNEKMNFSKKQTNKVSINPKEFCIFEPVYIPKPWGQEIWFTGVEKRGVSKISSLLNTNVSIPLPWLISALPKRLLGEKFSDKNLTLVKILDPLPVPVFGDLYYELHTEKNEVYVVTEISSSEGKIKFGSNLDKLKKLNHDSNLYKSELLKAIKQYEEIRKKIDIILDDFRKDSNIPLNEPLTADKLREWLLKVPNDLIEEEKQKREIMDSYAGYLKLNIGDVIRVPTFIPHALQHGVKVIEFQTATYERFILSFAQKVLTQNHWDTEKALEIMTITPPAKTELEVITNNDSYCEECVCSFKEFHSSRLKIKADKIIEFSSIDNYRILFHVAGKLSINSNKTIDIEVEQGSCIFIPAKTDFELKSQTNSTILFCIPHFF